MSTLRDILQPHELIANAIQACLTHNRRVLVVGTKAGNLPDWANDHPQIVRWDSDGPEVQRATALPDGLGALLFFRWVGHHNHKRILNLARALQVKPGNALYAHPELLKTGEVRRLIAPLAPKTPEPVVTPTPAVQPSWEGSLFGFVEKHYDYAIERGHQKVEAERLLRLAYQHGLTSTLPSVAATISTVHRSIERKHEAERLAALPPPPDVDDLLTMPLDAKKVEHLTVVGDTKREIERKAVERLAAKLAPPVVEKPSVKALVTASATNEAQVDTSLAELLRMLDDAVAVLGLAREQLVDLSAKNTALRASREALRAKIMGVFEGI